MEYRKLGRIGLTVSVIGGTAPPGDGGLLQNN
jgi:hypothetical protein